MNRRIFIKNTGQFGIALSVLGVTSCVDSKKKKEDEPAETVEASWEPFFKLSLAQWSLNRAIREGSMDPFLFASKAKELGFQGIEYVSQLYTKFLEEQTDITQGMQLLVDKLNAEAQKHDIRSLLIMIDGEGDIASTDEKERTDAIENHKKWVDAAAALGCHSIRVNLFGAQDAEAWKEASVKGLSGLAEYAAGKNINVLVENHGYFSSNAALLAEVMKTVNKPNCGTLPDFGNFCLRREGNALWDAACVEEYDKYQGVEELMPYAKAVSAKSYDFDENGIETTIDYGRMMKIVKDAGYTGFVGVEYEGNRLGEVEGIIATKDLLLSVAEQLK